MKQMTRPVLTLVLLASMAALPVQPQQDHAGFDALVDEYLDHFSARHPSIAAGNGLHAHDDLLEDFSAESIAGEVAWLRAFRSRLDAASPEMLTADQAADKRILLGIVDGWLLDLNGVKTWTRNPMIYVAAISDGVHNLMTMESSAATDRMRQLVTKLQAVPRLLTSARTNITNPPAVFVERAVVMLRGTHELLVNELPLAFRHDGDEALRNRVQTAASAAAAEVDRYRGVLQNEVLPRATGAYAVGLANVEARYRAEELIDLPAARLVAIGERELATAARLFDETARRIAPDRDPPETWRAVLQDHPKPGELAGAAQKTVDELFAFVGARGLVNLPPAERVVVAPAPEYDLGLASMHSSPPLEPHPVKSFYYVTDARTEWPPDQQDAWLQKFNYPTLADITAHEVVPGHYVHSLFMRRTPGKIRRIWIGLNPFPQPSSGQDGWAHYAEQLVADEGFHADDPRYRLAQTSEALTRIVRLLAGIRLHSGEWTIDEAATRFERDAHLPAPAAHQEAVRGTYDPTYGGYFLGKLAALQLRDDYKAYQEAHGRTFSLREFHERVMTDGIAPWAAHRRLLMPGDTRPVLR